MGYKDKKYCRNLQEQAYDRLYNMIAFGDSKKDATDTKDKIFSISTFQSYHKHIKYYINYLNEKHPDIKNLKQARGYIGEWLQLRVAEGKSAWTISLEAKALGKLFGITPDDKDYFKPPARHRADIQRSRNDTIRDTHFSKINNKELINFCRGAGLRRSELGKLRGKDMYTKDQILKKISTLDGIKEKTKEEQMEYSRLKDCLLFKDVNFFIWTKGKGGRIRYAPIIGEHADQIISRIKNTPENEKVWKRIHSHADIHSYRSDYATAIYKMYARDIKDIPYDKINCGSGKKYQGDVYICRRDQAGKKLDKKAMYIASKALGHNRISVIASNYLRD